MLDDKRIIDMQGQIAKLKKRLDIVDTITSSTAIGTDLHPKKIGKLEEILQVHISLEATEPDLLNFHTKEAYNEWLLEKLREGE